MIVEKQTHILEAKLEDLVNEKNMCEIMIASLQEIPE